MVSVSSVTLEVRYLSAESEGQAPQSRRTEGRESGRN